jgi:FkbM family methyltransferase
MNLNISGSCQIANLGEVYEKNFPDLNLGTFVEVGAMDGHTHSNTSCLADIGWTGVYVEPIKEQFDQCVNRHAANKAVKCFHCAIGAEEKDTQIHVGGSLSTLDEDTFRFFQSQPWSCWYVVGGLRPVRQRRLENILREAGIKPGFELLVVDVEGHELSVFQSFDLAEWKPRVMIVEIAGERGAVGHSQGMVDRANAVRALIAGHGYTVFQDDGMNVIYLHPDNLLAR